MQGLNVDLVHAVTSVDLVTRALVRGGDVPDFVIFGDDESVSFNGLLGLKAGTSRRTLRKNLPKPQQVFWEDRVIGEEVSRNAIHCGEASNQRVRLI